MIEITISDDDLDLKKMTTSNELLVLGEREEQPASQIIEEIVPKLLMKKIEKIIPSNYGLMQVKLDVKLKGSLLGQELSGNIQITFGPKE